MRSAPRAVRAVRGAPDVFRGGIEASGRPRGGGAVRTADGPESAHGRYECSQPQYRPRFTRKPGKELRPMGANRSPPILRFFPCLGHALIRDALNSGPLVRVHGPAGVGKTSLVAISPQSWLSGPPHRGIRRSDVKDSLDARLFDLGERSQGITPVGVAGHPRSVAPSPPATCSQRRQVCKQ